MRVSILIEGQEGVGWDEWVALAEASERAGIETLFRSDHYRSVTGRSERGSLDAWGTIAALAAVTSKVGLGTLVSPVTFRHPSVLAKSAVTADQVAGGGRVELGMGTGWLADEHEAYGFPFPPTGERMGILEEQVEIVRRTWTETDLGFDGERYRLEGLDALPKPAPPPNLIVGGKAGPRSVSLAVRWADEYNLLMMSTQECRESRRALVEGSERAGREPLAVSLMAGSLIGADDADLAERARRVAEVRGDDGSDPETLIAGLPDSWVVGTTERARERLAELEDAGIERVMLQYLPHRDLDGIAVIGELAEAVS